MWMLFTPVALSPWTRRSVATCTAPTEEASDVQKLTRQVEKLLKAYNTDDVEAFFTGWSKEIQAMTNVLTYEFLYRHGAKKTLGDYTPRTLKFREEGSVLLEDTVLAYFEAEFDKEQAGLLTINFHKEDGEYRFVQVIMDTKK